MAKKQEIEFEYVEDQDSECERCGALGTRKIGGGGELCYQCAIDDAFEQMNERDN